jgi:signal transduction histidine kinase
MNQNIDLAYAYLGILGAFSAAQLLFMTRYNRVQVSLWLVASFLSSLGILNSAFFHAQARDGVLSIFALAFTQTGGLFRFLSLSYRNHSFYKNRLAITLVLISVFAIPLTAVLALSPYALFIGSCIGLSTTTACLLTTLGNPALKFVNKQPVVLIVSGLAIALAILIFRAATAFPFSTETTFVGASNTQNISLAALTMISFILQVGFTGVISERYERRSVLKKRAAYRISQRTIRLQERAVDTARIARARLDLVQLLTHEVRQPITNAQASLQSIGHKLGSQKKLLKNAPFALERARSSLDEITLALSNIIVASTIVSDERKWVRDEINAYSALQMSILDFSPEQQARIKINTADDNIFFESVSILFRLALQNIFDHALRFSNSNSNIDVKLNVDFNQEIVVFDIGFMSKSADLFNSDIFDRHMSNDTERSGISALGLFVVRQIMRELGGDAQLLSTAPDRMKFRLTLAY